MSGYPLLGSSCPPPPESGYPLPGATGYPPPPGGGGYHVLGRFVNDPWYPPPGPGGHQHHPPLPGYHHGYPHPPGAQHYGVHGYHHGFPPPGHGPPAPGPWAWPPPPSPYGPPPIGGPWGGAPQAPGWQPMHQQPANGGNYGRPGWSRSRSPARRVQRGGIKYTCRYFIGIENDDQFNVARRIIGAGGAKMKEIVAKAGGDAKLRLRGKGSGFVERDTKAESTEPLQLCISCPREEGYNVASQRAEELLRGIYTEYNRWCADNDLPEPRLELRKTEKHHAHDAGGRQNAGNPDPRGRSASPWPPGGSSLDVPTLHDEARPRSRSPPGVPPPGAPPTEEIERLIKQRNKARRQGDYREADRIRSDLRDRGVVLSDEKGGHGDAMSVTSWRFWYD